MGTNGVSHEFLTQSGVFRLKQARRAKVKSVSLWAAALGAAGAIAGAYSKAQEAKDFAGPMATSTAIAVVQEKLAVHDREMAEVRDQLKAIATGQRDLQVSVGVLLDRTNRQGRRALPAASIDDGVNHR